VENIKAKGVKGHVVKNHITMEDYKKCLFWDGPLVDNDQARQLAIQQSELFESTGVRPTSNVYTPFRVNKCLRSFKHDMKTISTVKLALSRFDDKRVACKDLIHTLAYGHYRVQ